MSQVPSRPKNLIGLTVSMAILNPAGFVFAGSEPFALALCALMVAASYVALWFFWLGRNWARILVLITSVIALVNILALGSLSPLQQFLVVLEAALGAYLLYWLNTPPIRAFFRGKTKSSAA